MVNERSKGNEMAQHRIHYEQGCKTGQKSAGNGHRIGLPLVKFHATNFETRCQACERAALRDGFQLEPESTR
ncbi:gp70 [Burkholderia phage BcepB1A]|uniref:gp70 n=1 Tax=Burkholderia phage BcepB1A TaxID=279530 RepID=UPI00003779B5|nr:gp70 [Burkholderia phage BcepB1A]AAT37762.1 gp70 [Burkholderia phage BcepB1A]